MVFSPTDNLKRQTVFSVVSGIINLLGLYLNRNSEEGLTALEVRSFWVRQHCKVAVHHYSACWEKKRLVNLWPEMATYLLPFSLSLTDFSMSLTPFMHSNLAWPGCLLLCLCPKLRCSYTMLVVQWHQSDETGVSTGVPEVGAALCVGFVSRVPSVWSTVCSGVL